MNPFLQGYVPLVRANRHGWPWTAPDRAEPITDMPKISIVTPCFNSAPFLEECIRSVVLQNYANLEYLIIDGGSTDETAEIINRYRDHISYWVSEPDRGQAHAINKGFAHSSGELFNWLNADDILLPNALNAIGQAYKEHEGKVILADVINIDLESGQKWRINQRAFFADIVRFWSHSETCHQPGVFIPSELWRRWGGLDESLELCMDYDLYCKITPEASFHVVDQPIVEFLIHSGAKTMRLKEQCLAEQSLVSQRYWDRDQVPLIDRLNHDRILAQGIGKRVHRQRYPLKKSASEIFRQCALMEVPIPIALAAFAAWSIISPGANRNT